MLVELSYNMGLYCPWDFHPKIGSPTQLRHLLGDPCQNCAGTNVDASWQGGNIWCSIALHGFLVTPKDSEKLELRAYSVAFDCTLCTSFWKLQYIYILYTCIYLSLFNPVSLRSAVSKPEEKSHPGLFSWIISGCSWGLIFQDLSEFSELIIIYYTLW